MSWRSKGMAAGGPARDHHVDRSTVDRLDHTGNERLGEGVAPHHDGRSRRIEAVQWAHGIFGPRLEHHGVVAPLGKGSVVLGMRRGRPILGPGPPIGDQQAAECERTGQCNGEKPGQHRASAV